VFSPSSSYPPCCSTLTGKSISGLPCSVFLPLLQRSNKWLLGHFAPFPLLEKSQSLLNPLFLRSATQPTNLSPFSTHTEQAVRFPNLPVELNPKFSSLRYKRSDMKPIPMLRSSHDISKQVKTIIVRFVACNKAEREHWSTERCRAARDQIRMQWQSRRVYRIQRGSKLRHWFSRLVRGG